MKTSFETVILGYGNNAAIEMAASKKTSKKQRGHKNQQQSAENQRYTTALKQSKDICDAKIKAAIANYTRAMDAIAQANVLRKTPKKTPAPLAPLAAPAAPATAVTAVAAVAERDGLPPAEAAPAKAEATEFLSPDSLFLAQR